MSWFIKFSFFLFSNFLLLLMCLNQYIEVNMWSITILPSPMPSKKVNERKFGWLKVWVHQEYYLYHYLHLHLMPHIFDSQKKPNDSQDKFYFLSCGCGGFERWIDSIGERKKNFISSNTNNNQLCFLLTVKKDDSFYWRHWKRVISHILVHFCSNRVWDFGFFISLSWSAIDLTITLSLIRETRGH